MTFLPILLVSCLCTLGGASFRAVDMWDQFYSSKQMAAKPKPALRGSFGKPTDMMPSLPAAVHRVDSADIVPSVADGSFGKGANKKAHPSLMTGWVSGDKSQLIVKH
jgi:hypothetical protein